jgi:hypothetical protein
MTDTQRKALRIKSAYPVANTNGTFAAHILLSNGAVVVVTIEGARWPELAFHTVEGHKVLGLDSALFPSETDVSAGHKNGSLATERKARLAKAVKPAA